MAFFENNLFLDYYVNHMNDYNVISVPKANFGELFQLFPKFEV